MAIIYNLGVLPHWVVIDNFSKLPPGAAIYTYSNLNPTQFKPAFQDPAGANPYSQPIVGFDNGTFPPIYWAFDSDNPSELYYIRVYSAPIEDNGVFLWDINNYSGTGSGGGGSIITITNQVNNLIANDVFYRNCGNVTGSPSIPSFITLAPSNNAGFVATTNANGAPAPDITFSKNNTSASDVIRFVNFTPLGTNDLGNDVTPVQYFEYQCTSAGSGETYKYIQFPVSLKLQNLSQQTASIRFYGRSSSLSSVQLFWRQFCGDGGGSADVLTLIDTVALSSSWSPYDHVGLTVPDATGLTLGDCGNDGLFLQIRMPLDATCQINLVKVAVYLSPTLPDEDYETYDEINAVIDSPRTGDIRTSVNNVILGWINMNDGTIGDASSGASSRANQDTFPLFDLIWNAFSSNQSLAPMYNAGSVSAPGSVVAYGANSVADFVAHKQISLTKNLGRVMAGALPTAVSQAFTNVGDVMTVVSTASFYTGVPVVVSGGGLPTPLIAGTTYYAIQLTTTTMSLASSPENAIAGTAITLTSNANGTVTVPAHQLGTFLGEEKHLQLASEVAAHTHPLTSYASNPNSSTSLGSGDFISPSSSNTGANSPANVPFNVVQPTVFMNVFIKL